MPNAVSWTVSGLSELTKKLGSLPDKIEKKVLRSAVSSGAKVIRDDARSRIHSKKGNLVEGIRFTTSVRLGQGLAVSRIFVSKKKAFYGKFVEYGTLPHLITPKGLRASSTGLHVRRTNRAIRQAIFGKEKFQVRTDESQAKALKVLGRFFELIKHPGSKPRPFMEQAVDAQAQNAVTAIASQFKQFFDSYHG
jgi:HK97 gp10 family phage protein